MQKLRNIRNQIHTLLWLASQNHSFWSRALLFPGRCAYTEPWSCFWTQRSRWALPNWCDHCLSFAILLTILELLHRLLFVWLVKFRRASCRCSSSLHRFSPCCFRTFCVFSFVICFSKLLILREETVYKLKT